MEELGIDPRSAESQSGALSVEVINVRCECEERFGMKRDICPDGAGGSSRPRGHMAGSIKGHRGRMQRCRRFGQGAGKRAGRNEHERAMGKLRSTLKVWTKKWEVGTVWAVLRSSEHPGSAPAAKGTHRNISDRSAGSVGQGMPAQGVTLRPRLSD